MNDGASIIARWFDRRGDELSVDGVGVREIADRFGTPVFVHGRSVLERKLSMLRDALPDEFHVYYSIKANPNQEILRFFVKQGVGLELASVGELYQALQAGCRPENLVFAGPGKTDEELELALNQGVGELHAESIDELDRLAGIARRLGVTARVAIRVNPASEARGGAMQMGGKASPFGLDEERLDSALDRIAERSELDFRGIHMFTGTQILDHEVLFRQYGKAFAIGKHAAERTGRPLATLDFGGGLGIPYFPNEQELEIDSFGERLKELYRGARSAVEFEGTRFLVEPGRFLVGESGIYLVRITSVKQSRGRTYYITDGGMHHHLAASGNLGQVIKRNFPGALATRLGVEPAGKVDVVGPLCTPLDVLARDVELPPAEAGDLFAVFQSGAYARAASPLGFLSHPTPPEVLVDRGRSRLTRKRGTAEAYLFDQPAPDPVTETVESGDNSEG